MNVVFAREKAPAASERSIFLAGPSPRSRDVKSWRPQALQYLGKKGFQGTVFVPEDRHGNAPDSYLNQVEWETDALLMSDIIVFWVPRDMDVLPGFTTNVEFGEWVNSGRVAYGRPDGAPKTRYLDYKADTYNVIVHDTLNGTLDYALSRLQKPVYRTGAECLVPLDIWHTEAFQEWYGCFDHPDYAKLKLDDFKPLWTFYVGPKENRFLFAWAAQVSVYIVDEGRYKTNEFIIARPDIAVALLTYKNEAFVAIREYRAPVANKDAYVHELPGGSTFNSRVPPSEVVREEIHEEVGLEINPHRFESLGARQLASTILTHKAHLYRVRLTDEEYAKVQSLKGQPLGNIEDTERVYLETYRIGDIPKHFDWSMVGMLLKGLST